MSYRFVENQGKIELHQYFELLTKESYCNQPWIEKHKRKWVTVDQDLLIHRPAKEVGEKKVELVAESKKSEYLLVRLVYLMMAIVKMIFAFFFGNRSLSDKKEYFEGHSVVLFTTYERKRKKRKLVTEPLLKDSPPKSYIVMVLDEKQSKVSHSKSGILMASDEEKVQAYCANPRRPLPLFPEFRKKIERKIAHHPLSPETQVSTSPTEVPTPIPVQAPTEINFEASGADQDEYLAF